jgi:hypothetical protein
MNEPLALEMLEAVREAVGDSLAMNTVSAQRNTARTTGLEETLEFG